MFHQKKYHIQSYIAHDEKLKKIIDEFKPEKIPPKKVQKQIASDMRKIQYEEGSYTYPYDENDTFYYHMKRSDSNTKRPILILCFMSGHSKTFQIRRVVNSWYKNGHNCYVLLPRGTLGKKINENQKKFRSEGYDTEDIDVLIGIIKKEEKCEKIDVQATSLGCLQILGYLVDNVQNKNSINNVYLNFCAHYPELFTTLSRRVQKAMCGKFAQYLLGDCRQYYINHGIKEEDIDRICKENNIILFDKTIWCPRTNTKTPEEYYHYRGFEDKLDKINKDTTVYFFNTADDFITKGKFQTELINKTSNANFVLFDKGNHLGTVTYEGDDLPTRFAVQLSE